jgi:NADH-quinone oxidoreductase subunit G
MCTRCVRFTREVSGTSELMVQGRGNKEEIDVFPGVPIDNELSGNVIDLCPVGALLDKDFLFAQRVWFLKETPSIDPLTSSGDNITVHHNEGAIYRVKPRRNLAVNKWWISDEVRYGWKFVHSENRLTQPLRKQYGTLVPTDHARAYGDILEAARKAVDSGKRVALMVSPTLACEEAFTLARAVRQLDPKAHLALGPVPVRGSDKIYPVGAAETDPRAFRVCAEKCPNSRGVRRVLQAFAEPSHVASYDLFLDLLGRGTGASQVGVVILTGNFPSEWVTDELLNALSGKLVIAIDTLAGRILEKADIVLPGATFAEKAGTFENHKNMIQAFEQAFAPKELARSEGQIGLDLSAAASGSLSSAPVYNAANVRRDMAAFSPALGVFQTQVHLPTLSVAQEPDMEVVEL